MNYYRNFSDDTANAFSEFYDKNPQLYKRHEKKYLDHYDSPFTDVANTFIPNDMDEWARWLNAQKLTQYECQGMAKVDRYKDTIILSIYAIISDRPYLQRRAIYHDSKGYCFVVKSIGTSPYAMLHCDGNYKMGGWTDYDRFYSQRQRQLDGRSMEILKSIDTLKYLPMEDFKNINVYSLLDTDDKEWLYQMEILLKMGKRGLATDLLLRRRTIPMRYFKMYKREIMGGVRYDRLSYMISAYENQQRQRAEKMKNKELIKLYAKLPKKVFDIGDYIIKHPDDYKELEHEGNILHHCVARYLPKIVSGESEVLLLRKKSRPNDPYFTIEIADGRVVQVRTTSNAVDESITHLVKQWNDQRVVA